MEDKIADDEYNAFLLKHDRVYGSIPRFYKEALSLSRVLQC